jgi:hypothetical protein
MTLRTYASISSCLFISSRSFFAFPPIAIFFPGIMFSNNQIDFKICALLIRRGVKAQSRASRGYSKSIESKKNDAAWSLFLMWEKIGFLDFSWCTFFRCVNDWCIMFIELDPYSFSSSIEIDVLNSKRLLDIKEVWTYGFTKEKRAFISKFNELNVMTLIRTFLKNMFDEILSNRSFVGVY